jgi:hypothetical protein
MPAKEIYLKCEKFGFEGCTLEEKVRLIWTVLNGVPKPDEDCEAVTELYEHHCEYSIGGNHGSAKMLTRKNGTDLGTLVVQRTVVGIYRTTWQLTENGEKIFRE